MSIIRTDIVLNIKNAPFLLLTESKLPNLKDVNK